MQEATRTGKSLPGGLPALFLPGGLAKIALTAIGCLFAALAGAWCLARSARRLAARALPAFDADSFVHAVALATVVAMTLMLFAPLAITGEPPLLAIIRNWSTADFGEKGGLAAQLSDQNLLVDQVYSFLWLVPMGIVVVGWPLHRTLPAALRRVGFVVPTLWQVLLGLWLAGFLAFLMAALVDPAIGWLWKWLHWPQTDEKAFEQLFKSMTSPVGAVVVAVTAGVGEELFARGILQPRLGILLSNLFFTAMHAPQYSWDALLSVFTVGLVLGVVRQKTNTSTSAIVHGTYDFLLVMAAYKQIDPSQWFGW
jgi:membrane protease YdiL (CAAX protease family)